MKSALIISALIGSSIAAPWCIHCFRKSDVLYDDYEGHTRHVPEEPEEEQLEPEEEQLAQKRRNIVADSRSSSTNALFVPGGDESEESDGNGITNAASNAQASMGVTSPQDNIIAEEVHTSREENTDSEQEDDSDEDGSEFKEGNDDAPKGQAVAEEEEDGFEFEGEKDDAPKGQAVAEEEDGSEFEWGNDNAPQVEEKQEYYYGSEEQQGTIEDREIVAGPLGTYENYDATSYPGSSSVE